MADGGIIFELFLCKLDAQFEVRCVVLGLLVVVERLLEDLLQLPAHALPVRLVALGCVVHLIRAKAQPSSLQQLQSSSLQKGAAKFVATRQPSSLQCNQVGCKAQPIKLVAKCNQVRCKAQPSSLQVATKFVANCNQPRCKVQPSLLQRVLQCCFQGCH